MIGKVNWAFWTHTLCPQRSSKWLVYMVHVLNVVPYHNINWADMQLTTDERISQKGVKAKSTFVCVGFLVPLENFSLIWRRHHCLWRAAKFDQCSTLWAMRVLKRATTSVTRVICLWWPSPRILNTHTYCRAYSSGALTTCFYD